MSKRLSIVSALVLAIIVAVMSFTASGVNRAEAGGGTAVDITLAPNNGKVQVGKIIDVGVKVDSKGSSVGALQIFLKLDPTIVRVVDMEQNSAGVQPQVGNCPLRDFQIAIESAPGEIKYFGGLIVDGANLSCTAFTFRLEGIRAGTSALSFDPTWTKALDGGNTRLAVSTIDGQVGVVPPISIDFAIPKGQVSVSQEFDIQVKINSFGLPIGAAQILVEVDPTAVKIVDMDPNRPGTQPKLGNCGLILQVVHSPYPHEVRYGAASLPGAALDCTSMTIRLMALKAGTTRIKFNGLETKAWDEREQALVIQTTDGQIKIGSRRR